MTGRQKPWDEQLRSNSRNRIQLLQHEPQLHRDSRSISSIAVMDASPTNNDGNSVNTADGGAGTVYNATNNS